MDKSNTLNFSAFFESWQNCAPVTNACRAFTNGCLAFAECAQCVHRVYSERLFANVCQIKYLYACTKIIFRLERSSAYDKHSKCMTDEGVMDVYERVANLPAYLKTS